MKEKQTQSLDKKHATEKRTEKKRLIMLGEVLNAGGIVEP